MLALVVSCIQLGHGPGADTFQTALKSLGFEPESPPTCLSPSQASTAGAAAPGRSGTPIPTADRQTDVPSLASPAAAAIAVDAGYGSSDSEGEEEAGGGKARQAGGEPESRDVHDGGISLHGLVRRMAKLADDR